MVRIPEPPLDPPERRLTADDIETLWSEANTLLDKICDVGDVKSSIYGPLYGVGRAGECLEEAVYQLGLALEKARDEEGEYEEGAND
jgi:hypothetical protein